MASKYSVRLTADTKQHDQALKKSANEVYKYQKRVDDTKKSIGGFAKNFAKSGLGKLGIAFSAAGVAMEAFNKTIKSTQASADKFDEVIAQARGSVDYFFTSLSRGDFSNFLDGLKDVITAAKEAQQAIDNLQTTTLMTSNAGAKYAYERSRLERIIKTTTDPNERKKAQEELKTLPETYTKELQREADAAWRAFYKKGEEVFKKVGFTGYNDELLKKFFSGNEGYNFWSTVYPETLGQITDEDLKAVSDLYKRALNTQQSMNQLYSENARLENYRNTGSTTKTTKTPKRDNTKIDRISNRKYIQSIFDGFYEVEPELDEFGDIIYEKIELPLERVGVTLEEVMNAARQYPSEYVEIIESAEEHAKRLEDVFELQLSTIRSMSSAFKTLGDSFDMPGLSAAGIIGEAIANIIKGYATASAQSATAGPWAWVAFTAAGLAEVASVIAQIHSLSGFANGGIIGGNTTIGDHNLARVNAGEMILNTREQNRLWRVLNGTDNMSVNNINGASVTFKIKGSDLVGTIDNYNQKTRRVR